MKEFVAAVRKDHNMSERIITRVYQSLPCDLSAIDGGAHHGYHTTRMADHFTGHVVAIEASPETFLDWQRNYLSRRKRSGYKACLVPYFGALGSRKNLGDVVEFFHSDSHPGKSTITPSVKSRMKDVHYTDSCQVPVLEIDTLADIYCKEKPVGFIKLDLEGGEYQALCGAEKVLTKNRPAIAMEFSIMKGNEELFNFKINDFVQLVKRVGYSAYAPWGHQLSGDDFKSYPYWYLYLFPEEKNKYYLNRLNKAFRAEYAG